LVRQAPRVYREAFIADNAFMNMLFASAYEPLYALFKEERESYPDLYPEPLRVRIHRALSWLRAAEKHKLDQDFCFLSLMIATHSCYTRNDSEHLLEFTYIDQMEGLRELKKIEYILLGITGQEFIKEVIANPHLKYNKYTDGNYAGDQSTRAGFDKYIELMKKRDSKGLFREMLIHLNMVRNAIAHGNRTYNSHLNSKTLTSGTAILAEVVPMMIQAIILNPDKDWGETPWWNENKI